MAGVGPTDLHDLASALLNASIEALDTIPSYAATLAGAPDRTFVAPGPVSLDCCDQLTVHVGTVSEGGSAPELPAASFARINRAQLVITAARCVPGPDNQGNPPPALAQEVAATQIDADKWALWNHLYNLIRVDDLFSRCCDVIWGALTPLQPNGGCGGSRLTITVCLDGYEEVQGTL
jgi:hypothetical protein